MHNLRLAGSKLARCAAAGARGLRVRAAGDEGGQAVVEFAVVIPLLLLVVFGIVKFGIIYNNYIQLTNAADAAARQFAIERGQSNPCQDVVTSVSNAAAGLNAGTVDVTMSALDGAGPKASTQSPWPSWSGDANATVSASSCPWSSSYTNLDGTAGTLVSGNAATLTLSYPFSVSLLGLTFINSSMSTSATESTE